MSDNFIGRFAAVESTVFAATPGNPYVRTAILVSLDSDTWTATVKLGSEIYTGIFISHQVPVEALVPNVSCLVALESFEPNSAGIILGTYGGKPPLSLAMDNVRGHAHRKGVPGDGAPVWTGDLADEQVET